MKIAICYYSKHHGNTLSVVEAMSEAYDAELIDVCSCGAVNLEQYDIIGFASGIYYGNFHKTVLNFAGQYLPENKKVFFVYTCGSNRSRYTESITSAVKAKNASILGTFNCRGYDAFGPFKLIGGIAKGHPNDKDLHRAKNFIISIAGTV